MKYADPLAVRCPHCREESRHSPTDLLALGSACPSCGASLDSVGRSMGAELDEWGAFQRWAELLIEVESRLGIPSPGIPDGPLFDTKPSTELTLLDLIGAIGAYAPSEADARRVVLESAENVAGRPVTVDDLGLPILRALGLPHWAATHAEMTAASEQLRQPPIINPPRDQPDQTA